MNQSKMICTLGDLLLDVVVTGSGPVRRAADTYSSITVSPGGQAANVAAWVAVLGGRARLVAKRVAGPLGQMLEEGLTALGVDVAGPVTAPSGADRTGVVVSLSGFDAERSMLTDRGACPGLRPEELKPEWFTGCDHLHLPLYSLVGSPIRDAAVQATRWCPRLSVDLSSLTIIESIGASLVHDLLDELRPHTLFATEAEVEAVKLPAIPEVVVKMGQRGVLVNGASCAAPTTEVADTTGAGDAFAAGYLVAGLPVALGAAARAVAQRGAFPVAVQVR